MDKQAEMAIAIAMSALGFSSLCELLIDKGVISEEEKEKIIDDAKNEIEKVFIGEK